MASRLWSYDHVFDGEPGWLLFTFCQLCLLVVSLVASIPPRPHTVCSVYSLKAGSLKMNTTLEYSTRVVQEGGRRCKKSTLNDLVHLTPLRIPLMNLP
jgi:hypothetical protein